MDLREDLRDIKPYAPGKSRPGAIKMASNENPLGPSPLALEALREAAARVHVYPDGVHLALREALAQQFGLKPENFAVGNGSDEVLTFITGAYVRPGDTAIVGANTFSEYEFAMRLFGGSVIKVALREADGAYDPVAMVRAIVPSTRIVFLCNPNNPTGGAFRHDELVALLDTVPSSVLVVLDEAYAHYATAAWYPRSAPLLAKYPNLVILRTFSKIYGLAAIRVGFAVASPAIVHDLAVVKQPFNVGTLGQVGAKAALADTAFVEQSLAMNREAIAFWETACRELGLFYYPTQANFIALRVDRDSQAVFNVMAEHGVTIRALTSFGLPQWIRITSGPREHNELCLKALRAALDTIPVDR